MKYRPYQKRMIAAQDAFMADPDAMRGTILAATGAGKTEVFIYLIEKIFTSKPCAQILIAHPRIALSQDQQKRLSSRLGCYGVEFTSFHSGHQKYHTLPDRKNLSTTNADNLEDIRDEANGPHITFSSYKSLHKIAHLEYDVIICDEAHYLVQPDIRKCLSLFESKVLFYTGTPIRAAAQEESMDNIELFGDVLAEVPPSELIPMGYIVPPRIRLLDVKNQVRNNTYDYPTIIGRAFADQLERSHVKFNHKMLVAMPKTLSFPDIMQELSTIRDVSDCQDLDFYYITASRAVKNGAQLADRETALNDFHENTSPCIIMHCDTLAEGIDVDGLGGVLIMRGLGMVKAHQTMGRGCRPAKADILKSGKIRKNRIKTECFVTIARVDDELVGEIKIDEWAQMFREAGYGDLWDYYEDDKDERELGADIGEHDDTHFDIIHDIRIQDGVTSFRRKFDEFMENKDA